jgi:phytoene dehydrogenase-like protein
VAYSPSAFCVRLAVDEPTAAAVELPHETVLFGARGGPGEPGGRTIRVHVAPEKPREWVATVTAKRDESDADATAMAMALSKELAHRLGVPSDGLTVAAVLTPADFERLTGTPGGSLHGPVADSLSSAILRSPTVQPIKGLLHIGGSARPGPGLAFAALGAWNAAEVLKPTRV